MRVTLLVSQPEISWLNEEAPLNISFISITLLVFQAEISSSNVSLPLKSPDISSISLVSHELIGPYSASAAAGSAIHAFTAIRKLGVALKSKVGILYKKYLYFIKYKYFLLNENQTQIINLH